MNKKVWIKIAAALVTTLTINDIVWKAVMIPWLDE